MTSHDDDYDGLFDGLAEVNNKHYRAEGWTRKKSTAFYTRPVSPETRIAEIHKKRMEQRLWRRLLRKLGITI